jgi:hypothetical protein
LHKMVKRTANNTTRGVIWFQGRSELDKVPHSLY